MNSRERRETKKNWICSLSFSSDSCSRNLNLWQRCSFQQAANVCWLVTCCFVSSNSVLVTDGFSSVFFFFLKSCTICFSVERSSQSTVCLFDLIFSLSASSLTNVGWIPRCRERIDQERNKRKRKGKRKRRKEHACLVFCWFALFSASWRLLAKQRSLQHQVCTFLKLVHRKERRLSLLILLCMSLPFVSFLPFSDSIFSNLFTFRRSVSPSRKPAAPSSPSHKTAAAAGSPSHKAAAPLSPSKKVAADRVRTSCWHFVSLLTHYFFILSVSIFSQNSWNIKKLRLKIGQSVSGRCKKRNSLGRNVNKMKKSSDVRKKLLKDRPSLFPLFFLDLIFHECSFCVSVLVCASDTLCLLPLLDS